jgi:hypothetical protein
MGMFVLLHYQSIMLHNIQATVGRTNPRLLVIGHLQLACITMDLCTVNWVLGWNTSCAFVPFGSCNGEEQ